MIEKLSGKQRMIFGLFLLVLVDLIWVGSSELTDYLFKVEDYRKPYFTTYLKTTMFTCYLIGFLFNRTWRSLCQISEGEDKPLSSTEAYLSEPVYLPIKNDDDGYSSNDSDDTVSMQSPQTLKSVRFSDHTEVRCVTNCNPEDASLARMSYESYLKKQEEIVKLRNKFTVPTICKLALVFCLLWFLANFSYQEALLATQTGIVNVLSSTSGLFTLIFAAFWSSGPSDRFTLSKFLAVLVSVCGTAMICFSDASMEAKFPAGTVWAIVGALAYATYLVALKRKVKYDGQLEIPMFFGFVGFFNLLILWPGLVICHYTQWETFQLPTTKAWLLVVVNGLVGTVLSELLWLWGCFLTSSLIGTLALSLTTPLTMIFDVCIKKVSYNWMFYVGVAPIFLSFVAVTVFSHYDNWDPALIFIKKILKCFKRSMQSARMRELEVDQSMRLLSEKDNA